MQKAFDVGLKLFFYVLITCLIAFIYFKIAPVNMITISAGMIICILYFGVNFYVGYKYRLTMLESIIVGTMGCGVGIFLSFFSIYMTLILQNHNEAIWIIMPYLYPTTPIVELLNKNLSILYLIQLMLINIGLVIIGSFSRKIMNKFIQ